MGVMPFTEEQMKQVFATNLIDFAVQNGFEIEKGDRNTVHVKHSGGLFLFKHGRGYYCFSTGQKGNIIDFAKEYLGAMDFKSAVEMILGCEAYAMTKPLVEPVEKKKREKLILPEKDKSYDRTIAYLIQTRGIDKEIVYDMIKKEKVYGARTVHNGQSFHNCAFVGYDEKNEPRYCSLRSPSTYYKFQQDVENSDKTYGFCMEGTSNRVYEFEAPIDAMSHATLCKFYGIDWRKDHRVAEGGLLDEALKRYLALHKEITEIVFCYDNDREGVDAKGNPRNHGQIKAKESALYFAELGYQVAIQTPKNKDFNLDLQKFYEEKKQQMEEEEEWER